MSRSADATRAFGRGLGRLLRAGDVVVLTGDLGAGKTLTVQAIAAGLGVTDRVTSPTFALVHHYDGGPVPVVHIDAWRLDTPDELVDLGVEDILGTDRVTIVEWGERVAPALPADRLMIELAHTDDPDHRRVRITADGPTWVDRVDGIEALVAESTEAG